MGDRCYLRLYFFAKDREIVQRECGADASDIVTRGATACLEVEEANYALYEELNKCTRLGLIFHGRHGAGNNYTGGRFVAKGGECLGWPAIDAELIAWVDEGKAEVLSDGEDITIHDLSVLRRFLAVEREVHALLPAFNPAEAKETSTTPPLQDMPEEEDTTEYHDKFCVSCGEFIGQCHDADCTESESHYSSADDRCSECVPRCDHGVRKDRFRMSCRDEYVTKKYNDERECAVIEAVRCADFHDTLPIHL